MQILSTAPLLASSSDSNSGAGVLQFGILLLIPVAMYFLLIRPQRKRLKAQQAMQTALGVGDEVITNSGIYGFITGEEPDLFWLEIDDDVQIRIAKAAIQNKVNTAEGSKADTKPESKADAKAKAAAEADELDTDWEAPAGDA